MRSLSLVGLILAGGAARGPTLQDIIDMSREGKPPRYERVAEIEVNPFVNRITYAVLEQGEMERQMRALAKNATSEEAWAYFPRSKQCREIGTSMGIQMNAQKHLEGMSISLDRPELHKYVREHPEEPEVIIYHIHPSAVIRDVSKNRLHEFEGMFDNDKRRAALQYLEITMRMPSTGDLQAYISDFCALENVRPGIKFSTCVVSEFGVVETRLTHAADKEYRHCSIDDAMERLAPVIKRSGQDCMQMTHLLSRAGNDSRKAMTLLTDVLPKLSSNVDAEETRLFVYQSR